MHRWQRSMISTLIDWLVPCALFEFSVMELKRSSVNHTQYVPSLTPKARKAWRSKKLLMPVWLTPRKAPTVTVPLGKSSTLVMQLRKDSSKWVKDRFDTTAIPANVSLSKRSCYRPSFKLEQLATRGRLFTLQKTSKLDVNFWARSPWLKSAWEPVVK